MGIQGVRNCQYRFLIPKLFSIQVKNLGVSASLNNVAINVNVSNDVNNSQPPHVPVMLREVISYLKPSPGQVIVDMTCGNGGHTEGILRAEPNLKVFGLDRDPNAINLTQRLSEKFPDRFVPLLGRFSELPVLLSEHGFSKGSIDGFLFDLGVSSMQFDNSERGFGLVRDGPLDMRMDADRFPDQPTAADVIEHLDEESLARIIKVYGEEKQAKRIAKAITEAKYTFKSLRRTGELASLVGSVLEGKDRHDLIGRPQHGGTKTFQALRIFVNNEINELNRGMEIAAEFLKPNGKIVTISFHSLEDRVIKRHILGIDMDEEVRQSLSEKYKHALSWHSTQEVQNVYAKIWAPVNKHIDLPSKEEVETNPRSRSAKLRCAIKL